MSYPDSGDDDASSAADLSRLFGSGLGQALNGVDPLAFAKLLAANRAQVPADGGGLFGGDYARYMAGQLAPVWAGPAVGTQMSGPPAADVAAPPQAAAPSVAEGEADPNPSPTAQPPPGAASQPATAATPDNTAGDDPTTLPELVVTAPRGSAPPSQPVPPHLGLWERVAEFLHNGVLQPARDLAGALPAELDHAGAQAVDLGRRIAADGAQFLHKAHDAIGHDQRAFQAAPGRYLTNAGYGGSKGLGEAARGEANMFLGSVPRVPPPFAPGLLFPAAALLADHVAGAPILNVDQGPLGPAVQIRQPALLRPENAAQRHWAYAGEGLGKTLAYVAPGLAEVGAARTALEFAPTFEIPSAAELSAPNITLNRIKGLAFQARAHAARAAQADDLVSEVSFRPNTPDGPADYIVRADGIARNRETGAIELHEAKASEAARLTKRQSDGYALMEKYGGTVVGKNGGAAYPAGTVIPPHKVIMVRPSSLPEGY